MFKKWRFAADLSSKKNVSGEKKTFATISVVISSSSWLLRAMDPCRLLLDFKNRLFAPSKKTIAFKKELSLQKSRRFARSKKKTISFKKKLGASRRSVQKKIQKKTPAASRLISFKKNSKTFKKKLGASRRRSKKNSKIVFFWTDLFKKKHWGGLLVTVQF